MAPNHGPSDDGHWEKQPHGLGKRWVPSDTLATLKKESKEVSESKDINTTQLNETEPLRTRGGKKTKFNPCPDHPIPPPSAFERIHQCLAREYGEVGPPPAVAKPQRGLATCGEVVSLQDAVMRILISTNTSFDNADNAVKSLEATYSVPEGGDVTIDWDAVLNADLKELQEALKCGGLHLKKGEDIQRILRTIKAQNIQRRDALIREQKSGVLADIRGIDSLTVKEKADEIALIAKDPLSLEWIRHLKTDFEVIEVLSAFKGVGVKSAACAILFALQRPSFAVDTHVHRHCVQLGWVPATNKSKSKADATYYHLDPIVPDHLKYALHQLFIKHGKRCGRCKSGTVANTPAWNACVCPLEDFLNRGITEPKKDPNYKPGSEATKSIEVARGKKRKSSETSDNEEDSNKKEGSDIEEGSEFEDIVAKPRVTRARKAKAVVNKTSARKKIPSGPKKAEVIAKE